MRILDVGWDPLQLYAFLKALISVTLLLGGASAFACDCLAAVESLNITVFLKGPSMLKSCISAMFIASASP